MVGTETVDWASVVVGFNACSKQFSLDEPFFDAILNLLKFDLFMNITSDAVQ